MKPLATVTHNGKDVMLLHQVNKAPTFEIWWVLVINPEDETGERHEFFDIKEVKLLEAA
jgi:hypothetical protein